MRYLLKAFILGGFSLLIAAITPAQRFIAHVQPGTQTGYGWNQERHDNGYGSGGYDGGYGYSGYSTHHGHRSRGGYSYGTGGEPTIGYAHGEPDAVPSRYMEYDQALALGKQMLEEEAHPKAVSAEPSLGEIARQLRQASGSTLSAKNVVAATQDGNGQLVICRESACQ
jgi:hypothetical protein